MRDRLPLLAGLLGLAVAIGIGSSLIADGIRARNRGDTISVTGLAKQRIVSDYIVWDAHVTSRAATAPAASKQLSARLLAEGVPLAADPPAVHRHAPSDIAPAPARRGDEGRPAAGTRPHRRVGREARQPARCRRRGLPVTSPTRRT